MGDLGEKGLSKLADFSLSWAEGEVKMYRMYREMQNLDQNFSLKSWNCRKTSPYLEALGWPLQYSILSLYIVPLYDFWSYTVIVWYLQFLPATLLR